MPQIELSQYVKPFPGIRSSIFLPSPTLEKRTWIYRADDTPEFILDFHRSSLMGDGWRVTEFSPTVVAERGSDSVSVSASRRGEDTLIVYEVSNGV